MKPVLPDLEEFMRACRASMRHLSEDEFEEIACIVYFFCPTANHPSLW